MDLLCAAGPSLCCFADHARLFQFGAAKPLWLLPLALAVAVFEGEFAGAVFGAVCGLMWDWLAGRTVGMLALELLLLCFAVSAVMQLLLQRIRPQTLHSLRLLPPCWCSRWTGCFSTTCPVTAAQPAAGCGSCCPRQRSRCLSASLCSGSCAASTKNLRSTTAWCNAPRAGRRIHEPRRTENRHPADACSRCRRLHPHAAVRAAAHLFAAGQRGRFQIPGHQHHRLQVYGHGGTR